MPHSTAKPPTAKHKKISLLLMVSPSWRMRRLGEAFYDTVSSCDIDYFPLSA